jgi:single-strand DNA-binding protein
MYSNRVTIIGFLGKDAEARTTRNNHSFTNLSVATKRSWKNRETGEYESQTTWHRCVVIWNRRHFSSEFSF